MKIKTTVLNQLRRIFIFPATEKILLRFVQGAPLESRWTKVIPNHYQYPKPSWRRVSRFGLEFELDISDLVDWAVYFELREKEQDKYFSMVRRDGTVLDVGANIGSTVMRFARAVGSGGRVIGFEPDGMNFARCKKNVEINGLANVVLEPCALGARNARLNLYRVCERNPGMNRILPESPAGKDYTQVPVVRMDDYIEESKIENVDAIKIDVEGFELQVLQGAAQTIDRFRPKIFLELSDQNLREHGSSAAALVGYLESKGAMIYLADTGLPIHAGTVLTDCKTEIICEFSSHPVA
ncbi:MAG: FkbM family methyltransferase [Bacteriovoracia bacterium]